MRCSARAASSPRPRRSWACRGRRCTGASTGTAFRAADRSRMRFLRVLPLATRMLVLALAGAGATAALTALLAQWLPPWVAALCAALVAGTLMGIAVWRTFVPLRALFRALAGTGTAYRGGDLRFGVSGDLYGGVPELVE